MHKVMLNDYLQCGEVYCVWHAPNVHFLSIKIEVAVPVVEAFEMLTHCVHIRCVVGCDRDDL